MPTNNSELRLPRVSAYQERIQRSLTDFYEEVPTSHSAGQDWRLEAVQHINGYTTCDLCGHFPIRRLFWIHNNVTDETKCIGSECAQNYVAVDLVEAYTRRIERFQNRRRNTERRDAIRAERLQRAEARNRQFTEQVVAHSREAHADVIAFLNDESNVDGNSFLASVRRFMLDRGYITDAQAATVRRNMQSPFAVIGDPDENLDEPAGPDDAVTIPNGTFVMRDNYGEEHSFRIHTVVSGQLAGKRIIKLQNANGNFEGFAFVTRGGDLRLWRRFNHLSGTATDEAARALLSFLYRHHSLRPQRIMWRGWQITGSYTCRHCNRDCSNSELICGRCQPTTAPVSEPAAPRARAIARAEVLMSEHNGGEVR